MQPYTSAAVFFILTTMLKYLAVILILVLLSSCGRSDKGNSETLPADSIPVQTEEKPDAAIIPPGVDSFEIIYYKKPFEDSTRYSRFFKVLNTNDSTVIREIRQGLAGSFEKLPEVKKCLSEGKLIIPLGGDAYRTLFFSRLETDCPYLYYIKDGAFFYFKITPVMNERLNVLEKLAVEPK